MKKSSISLKMILFLILGGIILLMFIVPQLLQLTDLLGESTAVMKERCKTGVTYSEYHASIQNSLKRADNARAIEYYNEFVECFPEKDMEFMRFTEDELINFGNALLSEGKKAMARYVYSGYTQQYPNGQYLEDAEYGIIQTYCDEGIPNKDATELFNGFKADYPRSGYNQACRT